MNGKTYIISDLHFYHYNILKFAPKRRELAGITDEDMLNQEMAVDKHNKWLIELWNSTIHKQDTVYILGDVCLGTKEETRKILCKLNGHKHLITGNHDKSCGGENERFFTSVSQIKEIKFKKGNYDFIDEEETSFCVELCHYPLFTWNRRPHGSCMAHGHCHGNIDMINEIGEELRVDVGLDGKFSDYKIRTIKELYEHYTSIIKKNGCKNFQEYINKKMEKDKFRM